MQRAVKQAYPEADVTYQFIDRGNITNITSGYIDLLGQRIDAMPMLVLKEDERIWLSQFDFFPVKYLDYLENFRFDPREVEFSLSANHNLKLEVRGNWANTILWEVPLLALISETYYEIIDTNWEKNPKFYYEKSRQKGLRLSKAGCIFSDFGTRRRRSYAMHEEVVRAFSELPHFLPSGKSAFAGTSNVHLARKFGLQPIGTMAHEWIMGHAGLFGIRDANRHALEVWRNVFAGQLSIALTDTYTTDLFLLDFDKELSEHYDGVRQDSGSPIFFTDDIIAHYQKHGIDPATKKIIFSDSLNVEKAIEYHNYVGSNANPSFGIGTHFTNDFENSPALDIVIKMASINDIPVVKISDDIAKATGDSKFEQEAIEIINNAIGVIS